jgi:hypothetical protein
MKFSDATIDIRPRTVGEVIDLAVLFYRSHFSLFLQLTAITGLPALLVAIAIHVLTRSVLASAVAFVMLMPVSTGPLVLCASRLVFGESVSARDVLHLFGARWRAFIPRRLWQIALAIATGPLVLGYLLHLSWAFQPMIVLLEQLRGRELRLRGQGLARRGGDNPFGFDVLLLGVTAAMVDGVFSLVELMLADVFFVFESGPGAGEMWNDPVRVGLVFAIVLLVSPVYRLGWFFRYLDARIRAEGWDLELAFRAAAQRQENGDATP